MSTINVLGNVSAWEELESSAANSNTHTKPTIQPISTPTVEPDKESFDVDTPVFETEQVEQVEQVDEYEEVLPLMEYMPNGNFGMTSGVSPFKDSDFVIAEYDKIDNVKIDKKQQSTAKKFVKKIENFIIGFNDVVLTEDHKQYIREVSELQMTHLTDLLILCETNKRMIANIVARVNATQAEDYALIASYNQLINQHLKLIKETTTFYKSIPSVIKKMRTDVLTNQEIENEVAGDQLITEEYGERQFNNSKQLLKSILSKPENEFVI